VNTLERIRVFIDDKGLNVSSFEKSVGFSNGAFASQLKNNKTIGVDKLENILKIFPEINPNWLLTGSGNMYLMPNEVHEESVSYLHNRRIKKLSNSSSMNKANNHTGIPIYDVPIDASFLERYTDDRKHFEPIGFLNLPKLRNCNFAAMISGNSMYPIMKSGTIAACRIIENLDYFDEGEMYLIATTNGFETVKYVQTGENSDELKLIPHNEKIKPTYIKKSMVIRVCLVEAWINFR